MWRCWLIGHQFVLWWDDGFEVQPFCVRCGKRRPYLIRQCKDETNALITAKLKEVDRAARISEVEHLLKEPHDHDGLYESILEDRLAELRKDSNATEASLKGGDV